jgi:hypothetical protein
MLRNLIKRVLLEELEDSTKENLYKRGVEFIKYNNIFSLKDLRNKNEELYYDLVENGLARKIAFENYFHDAMGPDKRKIYVYTWEEPEKVAYVGLTCDVEGRHKKHMKCNSDNERLTAVGKYMLERQEMGLDPMPNYDVIVDVYLDGNEAAKHEQIGYDLYSTEYKMLNSPSMIGNLGLQKEPSKFDRPQVWQTLNLNDINSIQELKEIDPELADYVRKKDPKHFGLRGEKIKGGYTCDEIEKKAKEIGKEKIFKQFYPHLYNKFLQCKGAVERSLSREFKVDGSVKIYKSFEDLYTKVSPNIRPRILLNRLVKKGHATVYDKNQNLVTITYPNFMEETFRRKINKILIEMFKH